MEIGPTFKVPVLFSAKYDLRRLADEQFGKH